MVGLIFLFVFEHRVHVVGVGENGLLYCNTLGMIHSGDLRICSKYILAGSAVPCLKFYDLAVADIYFLRSYLPN